MRVPFHKRKERRECGNAEANRQAERHHPRRDGERPQFQRYLWREHGRKKIPGVESERDGGEVASTL